MIEEIEDIFENSIGPIPQNEIEGFVDTYIKEPKQESFDTSIFAGENKNNGWKLYCITAIET